MNGWLSVIVILIGVVTLSLILNPEDSERAKDAVQKWGRGVLGSAGKHLGEIRDAWNRTDIVPTLDENQDEIRDQIVDYEVEKRGKRIAREKRQQARIAGQSRIPFLRAQQSRVVTPPIDHEKIFEKIKTEANAAADTKIKRMLSSKPGSSTIRKAWVRRFLYVGMLIVMLTTDLGIMAFRFEALGYFHIPDEWRPLLDKVFFLTPFVFISSFFLAKFALDEMGNELSLFVKLVPFERGFRVTVKKVLPPVIIILGLSNTILLIYAASSIGSGSETTFQSYTFNLFIGLSLLTLIAGYLSFSALVDILGLVFGVPFHLIMAAGAVVIGLAALFFSRILGALQKIGEWWRGIGDWARTTWIPSDPDSSGDRVGRPMRDEKPPLALDDGTILLGLGRYGTRMAVKIGNLVSALSGSSSRRPLLYADVYSPVGREHIEARNRLKILATCSPGIPVAADRTTAARELAQSLSHVHSLKSSGAATIVCLVRDDDVEMSLAALKQYEEFMYQLPAHTPFRMILIWRLSADANGPHQSVLPQLAGKLHARATDESSLLAGTILITDDSSLIADASDHDDLIARAIASFIMSSRNRDALPKGELSSNDLSLLEMARQMKSSKHAFLALATGTIGVSSLVLNIDGQLRGVMTEGVLSSRLHTLMSQFLRNKLTSFGQAPSRASAAKFATALTPQRGALLPAVRKWMTEELDIPTDNVALIQADLLPRIDLSLSEQFPDFGGQAHPQLSLIYSLDHGTVSPQPNISTADDTVGRAGKA